MHAQREWASQTVLRGIITWSEMGKQNIQAKLKGLLLQKAWRKSLLCLVVIQLNHLFWKLLMQQTGKLIQAKTDSTNLTFYPSTFVFYPASILSVIRTRTTYNAISKILDLFSFKGGWKRLGPTQLGNDNVIHRPLDIQSTPDNSNPR